MTELGKYYEARDLIVDVLRKDLVGPVTDDEVINDIPTNYYSAGKLYPQRSNALTTEQLGDAEAPVSFDPSDEPISLANQREPSAMGITFSITSSTAVTIEISFATYVGDTHFSRSEAPSLQGVTMTGQWRRMGYSKACEWNLEQGNTSFQLGNGCQLRIIPRHRYREGAALVTASLVNINRAAGNRSRDAGLTIYQPRLKLRLQGTHGQFLDVDPNPGRIADPELVQLELLYRNKHCFARGHGCSATWDMENPNPSWVGTAFIPCVCVPQMRPRLIPDLDVFGMQFLSEAPTQRIITQLNDFLQMYERWIIEQSQTAESITGRLRVASKANMDSCRQAATRIKDAIRLLQIDPQAMRAFRLANKAMLLQRECSCKAQGLKLAASEVRWYPFQLAFILQEIRSFIEPQGPDRKVADLLFFPTGGGKTEAYLGISAFAIFLRRLRDPDAEGVTVIMRYTLRLLTIQQFQRASMLITACEHIRRAEHLGGKEISIGLWVGNALTPNKLEEAQVALKNQTGGITSTGQNADPVQVLHCPWCGSELSAKDYSVDLGTYRMNIRCPNNSCEFHKGGGLPVRLIDEDIYHNLPTYIVATVDKFAQLPKVEDTSHLFGLGVQKKPPELIIQDELHLITGPLGTMVGIYEYAIERLCQRDGIGPKIIASTATVRNAQSQIRALYGQRYAQFPPQGLNIKDSFFAVEAAPDERPDRMYMGIMGSGVTQTVLMTRALADFLFATRYLEAAGYPEDVIDAYWTTVGYFSTLRELGGALTLTMDTVQNRFAFLAQTKFAKLFPGVDAGQRHDHILELTSRKDSSEISRSLADLERPYTREAAKDCYAFVYATNMISVGVDVPRLSGMVVDSQPKSNSEYIQATSRVGRRHPGLIAMAFNANRSRDRSHYEQFVRFHTSLYKNVESTSVTPFSERARDRGLQALFVTLCRYLIPGMSGNEAAGKFMPDLDGVTELEDEIVAYVASIDPQEADQTREELDEMITEWGNRVEDAQSKQRSLLYWSWPLTRDSLLRPDTDFSDEGWRFRVMNSLRNVEPSSSVYIKK